MPRIFWEHLPFRGGIFVPEYRLPPAFEERAVCAAGTEAAGSVAHHREYG